MNNKINKTWETPQYSKKKIEKAGKIIASLPSKDIPFQEYKEAIDILNNWRSSHAYPLYVIVNKLRRYNPNAIVVQRLKHLVAAISFNELRQAYPNYFADIRKFTSKIEQLLTK